MNARCLGRLPPILTGSIGLQDQAFFSALGLLIEYLAHLIKERAGACCLLPVELTAVRVGPSLTAHREMISIDISEYGDPLHTRAIRLPFTVYRKPWVSGEAWMEREVPVFPAIPLYEMDFRQAIKTRQVEEEVLDLACRACVRIPLQEEGTARLLDAYLTSRLRRFHDFFYQAQHDPPECWTGTYDRTDPESMPGCVGHLLTFPNDMLLKPSGMQMVTRYLLGKEWHPRHIAGLIRSKFENPSFGWGVDWNDYDAGTRADFYVRIFSCLYLTGLDRLVDLNCTSVQEKECCFRREGEECGLEPVRQFLLSKLPHE